MNALLLNEHGDAGVNEEKKKRRFEILYGL
jgi:hypothetical protein